MMEDEIFVALDFIEMEVPTHYELQQKFYGSRPRYRAAMEKRRKIAVQIRKMSPVRADKAKKLASQYIRYYWASRPEPKMKYQGTRTGRWSSKHNGSI